MSAIIVKRRFLAEGCGEAKAVSPAFASLSRSVLLNRTELVYNRRMTDSSPSVIGVAFLPSNGPLAEPIGGEDGPVGNRLVTGGENPPELAKGRPWVTAPATLSS
ncbi:hypothetical protein [Afifella sp. IM 167]|uniref:hypothetical protein n=1 Tax=Afifella sp. IM 167 TaxID=2033586 RepID=UPI001CCE59EA|nr:hypothetical protein [Afifella sp. IM 167]